MANYHWLTRFRRTPLWKALSTGTCCDVFCNRGKNRLAFSLEMSHIHSSHPAFYCISTKK